MTPVALVALVTACLSLVLSVVGLRVCVLASKRGQDVRTLDPKPICGCEHHASFHDEAGCHFLHLDVYGREAPECGCKTYMGPEPLPEYLP
jgi:hypothetical protein